MRKLTIFFALLITSFSLHADEGMWLLKELNEQSAARMKELGFTFPIDSIYSETNPSLKDAVVIFGRGCTGVAVSDKGLIFTNHHCGYDDIQKLSSVEHDYLKDGFVSQSFQEELPAPGLIISFLDKTEDITEYMTSAIKKEDNEKQRKQKTDSLAQEYLKQFEGDEFIKAQIVPFYSNNKYYLVTYKIFKDIRLVFAPPSSVGKFGGETDNWMWPRHTGDFSVFRVYADENNNPTNYSKDNVPYTPKYSVPVSIKGYENQSYSMTIGYPGRTKRYIPSWGINQMVESEHKPRIKVRGVKQEIWKRAMNSNDTIRIKYASKYAISSNYWKNAMGMNEAIAKLKVIESKQELESQFSNWVSKKKDRKKKYGQTLDILKEGYVNTQKGAEYLTYFVETFYNGIEIIQTANLLNQVAKDSLWTNEGIKEKLTSIYKDYDAPLDQATTSALLKLYKENVPEEYLPEIYTRIADEFGDDFETYANWLFQNSKFTNLNNVLNILNEEKSENILEDPALELTTSLLPVAIKISASMNGYTDKITQGNREYMAGLIEMKSNEVLSPDANFTQRLSYGSVGGYIPADAISYGHYSTTTGIFEKEIKDDPEFNVQNYILENIASKNFGEYLDKDGTMHVNFLSNNDITGGNSGSPVFDGKAQLIGLAFDGNWEALSGDIVFNPELQRCINVDIRYVLYMIDKVGNCHRLIDELKIVR